MPAGFHPCEQTFAGEPVRPGRSRPRAAILKLCLPVLVCGLWAAVLQAQTTVDGAVRGTVLDPSGASIPGVAVRIGSPSAAFSEQTVTGRDGSFLFARVPPGEYSVAADATGFAAYAADHVLVELGGVSVIPVRLGIAGAAMSVTVEAQNEASAPSPDVPSSATSMVIAESEIHQLPVANLRWQNFALLGATVSFGRF